MFNFNVFNLNAILILTGFLLGSMVIVSCNKKRCESRKTGEQFLSEITKQFIPYKDKDLLNFKNTTTGETMSFEANLEEIFTDRICVKYLCELIADPFQPTPCEYYETQSIRCILKPVNIYDTLLFDILVYSEIYEEESILFFDVFSINFSAIGHLARGVWITEVHFDEPAFNIHNTGNDVLLEEKEEVIINGKTYQNVLKTTDTENTIYYQKENGVIAMTIKGEIWVLE